MHDRLLLPLSLGTAVPSRALLCYLFSCEVVAEWGIVMPQGLRLHDSYISHASATVGFFDRIARKKELVVQLCCCKIAH